MARAKQNEKAATVRTSTSSRGVRTVSKSVLALMVASALGLLWAGVEMTGNGSVMYAYGFFFTEFFAGVVTLVALSLTVMMGLLATDRLVLHDPAPGAAPVRAPGHRCPRRRRPGVPRHHQDRDRPGRAQRRRGPVHRRQRALRRLRHGGRVPHGERLLDRHRPGPLRRRRSKWFWRSLHSLAYLSWPFALFHGLNAGRAAKSWVVLSYLACVLLVVVALMVRLSVYLGKRTREQQQAAALNKAMTARATDEGKGRTLLSGLGRKKEEETRDSRTSWAEATLAPSWNAPTGTARRRDPERFTVPAVPEPGTLREPVRGGRPARETPPAPRRERDLEPAAGRRTVEREERDERPRRRDEDDAPVSAPAAPLRGGRRPRVGYPPLPATRRTRPGLRQPPPRRGRGPGTGGRRSRDEEDVAPVSGTRRSRTRTSARLRGRRARYEEDVAPVGHPPLPVRGGHRPAPPVAGADATTTTWPPVLGTAPAAHRGARGAVGQPAPVGGVQPPRLGRTDLRRPAQRPGRHSVEPDVPEEPDYWRPPARYVAEDIPVDDTPTLVDLASRRARKAAGDSRSRRKGRANADAVDGAYWAGLRGEAK